MMQRHYKSKIRVVHMDFQSSKVTLRNRLKYKTLFTDNLPSSGLLQYPENCSDWIIESDFQ